ncbi:MAG TPA: elongation factor G, partial [Thermoanaerobaculia bacterium]|nr:elongation factor G [Thermoanaerobaculia bacterium]
QVAYRETIKKRVEKIEGKFIRQSGGKGPYGHCVINMQPSEPGQGFIFEDKIVGGVIPREYIGPIEQGIKEALENGVLAGYPMVDVKVELTFGSYHDVDSSEMAFKIAGSLAFKDAMEKAKPTILEPIMKVEINTTEEFTGDIMGDLSHRRGRPQGMDAVNGSQIIQAMVPMSEMLEYARILRALTQGRSSFHMEFSHYEEVPRPVQDKLIAEYQKHRKEEHE